MRDKGAVNLSGYRSTHEHFIIGLMSGTSLDGVDAVLVRILSSGSGDTEKVELLGKTYLPYSDELRRAISALCATGSSRIDDLVRAHFGLSEWYAEAVLRLLSELGRKADSVDAIALHGQTVWHTPRPEAFPGPKGELAITGTLQIGSGAVLSERTGIPVISDFRSRDMAAGGEGAPLAPYIDALLFGSPSEGHIVQNIGGIGNATLVPPGASARARANAEDILAFDTGPGNMIIDALAAMGSGGRLRYDPAGEIAATGRVHEGIVSELMADSYFSRKPPKSTGREVYGQEFSLRLKERGDRESLDFPSLLATATAFTAESIARAVKDYCLPLSSIGSVIVAGGGALNQTLLRMLAERLPTGIRVETCAAYGVPVDARECMAFALMGHESLMGRPGNLPSVTGAKHPVILGQITL